MRTSTWKEERQIEEELQRAHVYRMDTWKKERQTERKKGAGVEKMCMEKRQTIAEEGRGGERQMNDGKEKGGSWIEAKKEGTRDR